MIGRGVDTAEFHRLPTSRTNWETRDLHFSAPAFFIKRSEFAVDAIQRNAIEKTNCRPQIEGGSSAFLDSIASLRQRIARLGLHQPNVTGIDRTVNRYVRTEVARAGHLT